MKNERGRCKRHLDNELDSRLGWGEKNKSGTQTPGLEKWVSFKEIRKQEGRVGSQHNKSIQGHAYLPESVDTLMQSEKQGLGPRH